MKFQKVFTLTLCSLFMVPQLGWGQARTSGTVVEATPTPTVEPVTTPTPSAINMNQMLNQTSSEQSKTAMIGAVAAGVFGMRAVSCCAAYSGCGHLCGPFIAAAAGSALVSAENSGKSAGNSDAACKFIAGGCSGSSSSTSTTASGDGSAASGNTASDSSAKTSAEVLAKTSQTLASVGAKVDYANQTVTTPDGKTSSFSPGISSSALAAAGLTASDLKSMAAKAIAEKGGAGKAVDAVENDGAIGVGGKSSASSETGRGFTSTVVSQGPKLGINRDPAQVAGLTANLNGTPIGVASDSIFGIIDRRYEYHDKKGSFLPSK